jgi:hypothetical protein
MSPKKPLVPVGPTASCRTDANGQALAYVYFEEEHFLRHHTRRPVIHATAHNILDDQLLLVSYLFAT